MGAELATIGLEAHSAAFDQVGHRRHRLAIVFAIAAYGQDQIPEAVVIPSIFCSVLFHSFGSVYSVLVELPPFISKLGANFGNITSNTDIDASHPLIVHSFL